MKADCWCQLCRMAVRTDIELVFMRSQEWLGICQVRSRSQWGFCSWEFFLAVWKEMIGEGLLIESFAPDSDEFPRYLLSRLAVRVDRGAT
jgi:hypothetical protein